MIPTGAGPGDRICPPGASALGATSISDIAVLGHLQAALGAAPGDTTARRTPELADERTLGTVARARAKVRAQVWQLITARPGGVCVALCRQV